MPTPLRITTELLAVLVSVNGCYPVAKHYGGDAALDVVRSPDRVRVYRVLPRSSSLQSRATTMPAAFQPTDPDALVLPGIDVISNAVVLDAQTASALSSILQDPWTYSNLAKGCLFVPTV